LAVWTEGSVGRRAPAAEGGREDGTMDRGWVWALLVIGLTLLQAVPVVGGTAGTASVTFVVQ